MNKILSQALKKAVSEYSPEASQAVKNNRPDLFSLNNETELFQNHKGIIIKIDRSKDANLTDFGKATLKDRYLGQNESYQDLFARVASTLTQMITCMHKEFITTSVIFGLCLQLQFYQTAGLKEAYLYLVFLMKPQTAWVVF